LSKVEKTPVFFNRELSWIEFNLRVMKEACREEYPLLERFKFLSITSSNFDEFFMVRAASIKRLVLKKMSYNCPSKLSAPEVLNSISSSTHSIFKNQYKVLNKEILPGLKKAGIEFCLEKDLSKSDLKYLTEVFHSEIFPVLTPLKAVSNKAAHNFGNLQLYNAFILESEEDKETQFAVVPLPQSLKRMCSLPADKGKKRFILLDEVVKIFSGYLFPGYKVKEATSFRLTKDMDLAVDEDDDQDFLAAMSEVLIHRQKSFPVRLEISQDSIEVRKNLIELLGLDESEVYDIEGMLDLKSLFELCFVPGFDSLKIKPWPPCQPRDLVGSADIFKSIKEKDILLHHPYEKFDPLIELVEKAAVDPDVLSIKMTLYRTSGSNSPIVNALIKAAMNNKQVAVLVELKARFDERQNIVWAKKLEEVGATVIYGVADLKVHCKYLMVIRREEDAVRRYLHLGTGNYNEKTAGIYGDLALMTCRDDLTYEACIFFNSITGYSVIPHLSQIVMAPTMLKNKILSMIHRETGIAEQGGNGLIMCKTNSISDPDVIKALYLASQAGVKVKLNVRGICMLVPGVKGLSENIEVVSIIGRYLEHSRIYYFKNNGDEEIYLASADLMSRNLERRIELMFPLPDESHAERTKAILEFYFRDNVLSHSLQADGKYKRVSGKKSFNSHEELYKEAKAVSNNYTRDSSELKVRRKQK
jgi:polyphosphate kinase